jgi:hypothetical protein
VTVRQAGTSVVGQPGVLLVLGLLVQLYVDQTDLSGALGWLARSGVPVAAILMPGGFFAASVGKGLTRPNRFIALVYAGGLVLAVSPTTLGVGLLVA